MPRVERQRPNPAVANGPVPAAENGWNLVESNKFLIYGESGTGKTTLWSTFPGRILVLICSGLDQPGELKSIDTPENRGKIDPRVITSVTQSQDIISEDRYDTVVLDHITGLQDLIIKEHLGLDEIPVVRFKKASKGESWGIVPQADWSEINTVTMKILRQILNLRRKIVVVAQEKIFKGKEDLSSFGDMIKPTIGAAMTPGVSTWLNPACDYVVQTFKRPRMISKTITIGGKPKEVLERGKGVEYCLRTEPHDIYATKFRVPRGRVLPDVIVDPTYEKIMAVIRGDSAKKVVVG